MNNNCINNAFRNNGSNCSDSIIISNSALAIASVTWQEWTDIADLDTGISNGTIFNELVLPFKGRSSCRVK